MRIVAGEHIAMNAGRFRNDVTSFESKDDVLTLLVHLGYLAFDQKNSAVFIPNTEVRGEFRNAIMGEHWKDVIAALEQSDRLLQATWNQDGETVAEILDAVHSENKFLTESVRNSLTSG